MTERVFEQRIEIILDTLRRRGCMLTYTELFNATEIKMSSLQTIVRSMVKTGSLDRNGRRLPARFGLPSEPTQNARKPLCSLKTDWGQHEKNKAPTTWIDPKAGERPFGIK